MWWNFVGRSHEEIVAFREAWQRIRQFGWVEGYGGDVQRLPAPPMPNARIKPRRNISVGGAGSHARLGAKGEGGLWRRRTDPSSVRRHQAAS